MKTNDRISGIFWLLVSGFACFKSLQVEVGTIRSPGPGFVPFWAGVIFALLAVVLLVKSFARRGEPSPKALLWTGTNWAKVLLLLGILCVYAVFLQKIGYLLSTFGLMFCLMSLYEKMKWWIRVLGSLLITSATYVVFNIWLGVQLPGGILG